MLKKNYPLQFLKRIFLTTTSRSSHQKCSVKKGNVIKKETLAQVFSCEFCETSKNTFFTEHLWATASEYQRHNKSRNISKD